MVVVVSVLSVRHHHLRNKKVSTAITICYCYQILLACTTQYNDVTMMYLLCWIMLRTASMQIGSDTCKDTSSVVHQVCNL
jgi:hypothetical protein